MSKGIKGIDADFVKALLTRTSAIDRCHNVAMVRDLARRRVPTMVFDFIDGAADDEQTLGLNRTDLEQITFIPRLLEDAPVTSTATTVLGEELSMPVLLGPTGLAGLHHADGEIAAARAAQSLGTQMTVSTMSSHPYRAVARTVDRAPWFQLYQAADDDLNNMLLTHAKDSGCTVLVVTIDIPVPGNRERDLVNGFTIPPSVTPSNVVDIAKGPVRAARWARQFAQGPGIALGSVEDAYRELGTPDKHFAQVPKQTWHDIDRIRERWPHKLVIKGVMSGRDARKAYEHGADGVIVSNHGGRQLDGLPSAVSVLPEVVDELSGSGTTVLYDGAVRRGADVLRAMALGADAVLIGRPWAWGLAAGGQDGVERVLEILRADLTRVQHHLGLPHVTDIDRTFLRSSPSVDRDRSL